MGVAVVGETPSLIREFIGETHGVLDYTQTYPPGSQHQKGPICLWVVGEVTESWQGVEEAALFRLRPLPHIQLHRRVYRRDPQHPRTFTNPHTWELAPEGPNLLVGSGGSE